MIGGALPSPAYVISDAILRPMDQAELRSLAKSRIANRFLLSSKAAWRRVLRSREASMETAEPFLTNGPLPLSILLDSEISHAIPPDPDGSPT